ncbi:MAG TPA: hypothetical protein VEA38_02200 [Terriglobales bacterium]|nr:hypothetical protein [Terriglobales bacterium]
MAMRWRLALLAGLTLILSAVPVKAERFPADSWWFLYVFSGYRKGGATTVGPFDTQAECERIRQWAAKRSEDQVDYATTPCWKAAR